jgi:hypothetical protein
MTRETIFLGGDRVVGFGETSPTAESAPQKHISPLLTFPAGGAVLGGLIGYGVKRNARGAVVGALVGAASPFVVTAAIITSGWRP